MTIAKSYKNNPFHNFAHASHVTMSVCKLLSRILAPKLTTRSSFDEDKSDKSNGSGDGSEGVEDNSDNSEQSVDMDASRAADNYKQRVHDHTYGITSDPLTQFACMFSALM